ncbi:DUF2938 family protein [Swaminathania salitolerans]|uniref:Membrane protein n=1 Tax=Swaminathania salitolerans TaxID=182838 RepID=A0A511BP99_9PROT|nr:DUF2938 family protein [Swaminathania salitolerans]GBQ10747.1 hypothetical protein AA21291_0548 [Swaminathania salitolerans LMG 21291]GEL02156.1 membrane protein [Swaminathania salitolerans]
MSPVLAFSLFVGIGSTVALDLWARLVEAVTARPATSWPAVGRRLMGLAEGQFVLDRSDKAAYSLLEAVCGWGFHYAVGIAYALIIALLWGHVVFRTPTFPPFLIIGVGLSTVLGLVILMPAMGGGILALRTASPMTSICLILLAHGIFACSQYGLARLLAFLSLSCRA